MVKTVTEYKTDLGGNTTVEYSDGSTNKFNITDAVTAKTDPVTGGITKIATLTQAQYDALVVKDAGTLYLIA